MSFKLFLTGPVISQIFGAPVYTQLNANTISSSFNGSGGLELDNSGNLIIGDFLSAGDGDGEFNKVMMLDADFNLSVYSDGFVGASGNNFDNNGIFYQSDIGANGIYQIIDGERILYENSGIFGPVGIVFDSENNLFVCNCHTHTIQKVSADGVSSLFSSSSLLFCPNGITIDEDDNLYVSYFSNGNIVKLNPKGDDELLNETPGGTTSGPSNGHLEYYEPTRTLCIASHGSNSIYALSIDVPDELIHIADSGERGNDDGDALTATFSRPNGIAISATGDTLYVNSAIPLTNFPKNPLNPQVIHIVTGLQSTVSVSSVALTELDILRSPNPDGDNVKVMLNTAQKLNDLEIQIILVSGNVVHSEHYENTNNETHISLRMNQFSSGIYYLLVKSQGLIIGRKKFVKS